MSRVKSYYELLGVNPNADREAILAIITKLRQKDSHNSYATMLDNVERNLCDPKKREEYNRYLINQRQAVSPNSTGKLNKPNKPSNANFNHVQKNNARQTTDEQRKKRRSSSEQTKSKPIGKPNVLASHYNKAKVTGGLKPVSIDSRSSDRSIFKVEFYIRLLGITASLLLAGGLVWLGHTAYSRWQAYEQASQGVETLKLACLDVENYIRQNHYFPEKITNSALTSPFYSVKMDNKNIVLTFNNKAADSLPNTQLTMLSKNVPMVGLTWQCVATQGFPNEYLPQKCY